MAFESAEYRDEVVKIEPKGIEHVADAERHGRVSSVFSLWFGANVELATLSTGVAAVALFGLNFAQAAWGLVVGNILGAVILGALSTYGPRLGVPQLVHSRSAFGFYGNFVPGILNAVAGVMWFAVNTVLGVFALMLLTGTSFLVGLLVMAVVQVLVAVYGYNMIHAFERVFAVVLTLVFVGVSVFAFGHAHYGLPFNPKAPVAFGGVSGGIIEAVALGWSYLYGWTTYASDYTRYLPPSTPPRAVFWAAATSNFIACVWLELVGVALATVFPRAAAGPNPVSILTGITPHWLVTVALLAVAIGTVTANVLNIYSGSLSALVVNLPLKRWMAAVLVGVLGGILAWIGRAHYYLEFEDFLFVLGYWLAPWAAIVLVDFFLVHRGRYVTDRFYDPRRAVGPGLWAWALGVACAVPFFNQSLYVGWVAYHYPQIGDVSYAVATVVAGAVYWAAGRRRAA
ncbi:MAG: cytosine permease [Actinomycetia bacterium]|nr:cytosine permease [Actinomycetes bacterium]